MNRKLFPESQEYVSNKLRLNSWWRRGMFIWMGKDGTLQHVMMTLDASACSTQTSWYLCCKLLSQGQDKVFFKYSIEYRHHQMKYNFLFPGEVNYGLFQYKAGLATVWMKPFVKMETKFEPIKSNWTIIRVSYFDLVFSAFNVAKKEKIGTNILKESRWGPNFKMGGNPLQFYTTPIILFLWSCLDSSS